MHKKFYASEISPAKSNAKFSTNIIKTPSNAAFAASMIDRKARTQGRDSTISNGSEVYSKALVESAQFG